MNPDSIERSMFDVLVNRLPIEHVIESREVDIAVSSIDLAGADMALSSQIGRERALEKALAPIKDRYDYIFIDTPPSLGLLTINAFVAATGVIVPVQTEYLSLRGLVQLENTLAMVRENLNPRVEIIGIVPTMYDRRITHSREADEILRENFGDLVYNTRIRKTVRFAEAPVKGTSVLAYEPTGEAAAMYRDLAKEVLSGQKSRQHA
jgi:chromosome partitioning protein